MVSSPILLKIVLWPFSVVDCSQPPPAGNLFDKYINYDHPNLIWTTSYLSLHPGLIKITCIYLSKDTT